MGNNYNFCEIGGTSTNVVFTGITSSNGSLIVSDTDVNQNQLPRGGVVVSLGSTGGLGVANLVDKVPNLEWFNHDYWFGTTGSSYGISTASYNNITGQLNYNL